MNRRQDNELRACIDRIQANLAEVHDLPALYARALASAQVLTSSQFGFIAELKSLTQPVVGFDVFSSQTSGENNINAHGTLRNEMEFLKPLCRSGNAELFSKASLCGIPCTSLGWPTLIEIIAIPILDGGEVVAVLCLANGAKPFSLAIAKRFWPLLTHIACIRRSLLAKKPHIGLKRLHKPRNWDGSAGILTRFEHSCPIGVIEINQNHKIVRVNPAAEKIFGINEDCVVDREITEFLPERFPNEHRMHTFVESLDNRAAHKKMRFAAYRADRSVIPIEVASVSHKVGRQTHHLLMIQDHSELEKTKAEQQSQIQKFKAVSDLAPVGILHTNARWECIYANDRWCEICRMDAAEVRDRGWINAIYNEDVDATLRNLHSAVIGGEEYKKECRFRTRLGEIVWVDLHARPLFGPHGNIDGLIATLSDVTYRRITEEKLRNMAELDSLTGLANRALFQDRLHQALERVERHGALALLCLDLDGFKTVNDSLGHDTGDTLLIEVAERIRRCVRSEDTVARVGGDEFMVLIEGVENANTAAEVSEKILIRLKQPVTVESQEVFITASIGISFCIASQNTDSRSLMKQADIALYRAKAEGRNNYQYYSPELEQASRDRLSMSNNLHRALQRNEFELFYQLQSNVQTGKISGMEALLRWHHPRRGLLAPSEFISLLEDTGLVLPVGNWVLDCAFQAFQGWLGRGLLSPDSHISVNLAPKQLRDAKVLCGFERAMDKSGILGQNILVEITESALLEESLATKEILLELKRKGVKIALDDFGTGYSSLTYLKRFPIDCIKIDRGFVQDILTDPEDSAITQAVIALARSLDLWSIAEGVDNLKKLEKLADWGCDMHQGFFLNKPCNAEAIETLLLNSDTPEIAVQNQGIC